MINLKMKYVKYNNYFVFNLYMENKTIIYNNGDKYIGQVLENTHNGYGVYFYKNGEIYEGNFKDGLQNGAGKFILEINK